jgi:molecular chaperone DnaJ
LNINIPGGIEDGMRLRLSGEGEAGDKETLRGDLFILVRIRKHDFFEREKSHLYCRIGISFAQAALGDQVEIPTLDDNVSLKIPAGIQSEEIIRVKGKGLKELNSNRSGDLFVKVIVKTPENLTKEQKALLRQFAEMRGEKESVAERQTLGKEKNIIH